LTRTIHRTAAFASVISFLPLAKCLEKENLFAKLLQLTDIGPLSTHEQNVSSRGATFDYKKHILGFLSVPKTASNTTELDNNTDELAVKLNVRLTELPQVILC
jgi:hypothetical protein